MLKEFLTNIAESIRMVLHTEEKINAQDFSSKIPEVYEAGYEKGLTEAEPTIEPLTITENGTYTAPDGVDGYSPVTVEVDGNECEKTHLSDTTDWSHLFENNRRSDLIEKLKFIDSQNVVDFQYAFKSCLKITSIPELDTSKGTNFSYMFDNCSNLTTVTPIDVSNGTNFSYMLSNCANLVNLPELDTSKGIDFTRMFYKSNIEIIPKIDTSKGTKFNYMFYECRKLKRIKELDFSSGKTSNDMSYIFSYCTSLTEIGFKGTINVNNSNSSFLKDSPNVNQESLHKLIDCMVKTGTADTYTIGIGSSNLARVSAEYVQKALDKGIKLQ